MNIVNILEEIEKVDGDVYERLSPRRKAMQQFFGLSGKVAAAALPFALGSMFNRAYGQSTSAVIPILNYALTLEHFEAAFYVAGVNAYQNSTSVSAADKAALVAIRDSEAKHVTFLQQVITSAGGTPVAPKAYDFSGGTGTSAGAGNGPFRTATTDYALYLTVAQVLEDTGVRAYKGRAAELLGQKTFLTAALGIHAVEARHAAKIRYMRRVNGHSAIIKPWITGANDTGVTAVNNSYVREDTVSQAGITITGINGTNVSANAATEAFDEALTPAEVLAIVAPFNVS